mgnify:CR=1 FL=1
MTDNISISRRSWNMSQIKGSNTKPELIVRSFLHKNGLRFRINDKNLPGKPDIVLKKYQTVIFVDGCFWHRHKGCKYAYNPKSREDFWQKKFKDNIERDNKINNLYARLPWRLIRIWECEINEKKLNDIAKSIFSIGMIP